MLCRKLSFAVNILGDIVTTQDVLLKIKDGIVQTADVLLTTKDSLLKIANQMIFSFRRYSQKQFFFQNGSCFRDCKPSEIYIS